MRSRRLWNRVSCLRLCGYAKGATRPSFSLVVPSLLPPDIYLSVDYFPNIFEKNHRLLGFAFDLGIHFDFT